MMFFYYEKISFLYIIEKTILMFEGNYMKDWKRTLLIGFIWGAIFFGWFLNGFLSKNWDFHLFNYRHWLFLFDEFRKGWIISAKSDWVFFFVVLTMFPVYGLAWRAFLRVHWMDLLHRVMGKVLFFLTGTNGTARPFKKLKLEKKSSKTTRPRAMDGTVLRPVAKEGSEMKASVSQTTPVTSNSYGNTSAPSFGASNMYSGASNSSMPAYGAPNHALDADVLSGRTPRFSMGADTPFGQDFAVPPMQQNFSIASAPRNDMPKDFDDILLEDIKLPERAKVEENIPDIFRNAGYELLPDVRVGKVPASYVAVGQDRIFVCQIDTEAGDWLADEERFNGEDPLWFSESSHRISPVFRLVEETKSFASRLSARGFMGEVRPIFIVKSGVIINAEDMMATWKDLNVTVCRTDVGGPDELPVVAASVVSSIAPASETVELVRSAL